MPSSAMDMDAGATAASSAQSDWASLPLPLLSDIFFRVTQCHEYELERTVEAWNRLASVCRHWNAAAHATTLGLTLTKASHLSPEARAWLSSVPLEALLLPRDVAPGGAEGLLLADDRCRALSGRTLRSVVDAGPGVLPSLPAFTNLVQVALYVKEGTVLNSVSCAAFRALPRLHCLSIAGAEVAALACMEPEEPSLTKPACRNSHRCRPRQPRRGGAAAPVAGAPGHQYTHG